MLDLVWRLCEISSWESCFHKEHNIGHSTRYLIFLTWKQTLLIKMQIKLAIFLLSFSMNGFPENCSENRMFWNGQQKNKLPKEVSMLTWVVSHDLQLTSNLSCCSQDWPFDLLAKKRVLAELTGKYVKRSVSINIAGKPSFEPIPNG